MIRVAAAGRFISASQGRGSSRFRHDQAVPVRINDLYFKRGAVEMDARAEEKSGDSNGVRRLVTGRGYGNKSNCCRIQRVVHRVVSTTKSPGSFRYLLSSIPS